MSVLRLTALGALSCVLFSQSERGSITGIITDPGGAAIAAAKLSVVNRDECYREWCLN
jgi:hypothetical protein